MALLWVYETKEGHGAVLSKSEIPPTSKKYWEINLEEWYGRKLTKAELEFFVLGAVAILVTKPKKISSGASGGSSVPT